MRNAKTKPSTKKVTVLAKRVESRILVMRGRRVILDSDLAEIYGVKVKRLNEQVKRNAERFPADFVFRMKAGDLRSQFATSNSRRTTVLNGRKGPRGGRRYWPYVFTEHGAIMAATVLNSKRAVQMSIFVVRAFVRMREAVATNGRIVAKLKDLEQRVGSHDADIRDIVEAIRELMRPAVPNPGGLASSSPWLKFEVANCDLKQSLLHNPRRLRWHGPIPRFSAIAAHHAHRESVVRHP